MTDFRTTFHQELDEVLAEVARLGRSTTESIARATAVILDNDLEGAAYLVEFDDEVDARSLMVEDRCYQMLALQAPVAGDLRKVVSLVRIIADVERSFDLIVNICKATRRLYGHNLDPQLRSTIAKMGEQAQKLFAEAIQSLVDENSSRAAALDDMDSHLDELHRQFIQSILDSHAAGRVEVQVAIQLAMIARFYERIGDHAVNVAEKVFYIVTGRTLDRDRTGEIPRVPASTD